MLQPWQMLNFGRRQLTMAFKPGRLLWVIISGCILSATTGSAPKAASAMVIQVSASKDCRMLTRCPRVCAYRIVLNYLGIQSQLAQDCNSRRIRLGPVASYCWEWITFLAQEAAERRSTREAGATRYHPV